MLESSQLNLLPKIIVLMTKHQKVILNELIMVRIFQQLILVKVKYNTKYNKIQLFIFFFKMSKMNYIFSVGAWQGHAEVW